MAEITNYGPVRRLRSEPTLHTLRFRRGALAASGRGLAFLFRPATAGVAEVPVDDRDVTMVLRARTADFQQVAVQAVVGYRVVDPERAAARVDFTIDLRGGAWRESPLDQLATLLTQLAQQVVADTVAEMDVHDAVRSGRQLREAVAAAFAADEGIAGLGIEVTTVRVAEVRPSNELEQAMQTPREERLQQQADEARFARRALAVDKERAIAENELANRLELERRREDLIGQEQANARREAVDTAETARLRAETDAATAAIAATADADATRLRGLAEAEAARAMMDVEAGVPVEVMLGMAARELAGNFDRVEHLNLGGDALGPLLTTLMGAGVKRLAAPAEA